MQFCQVVRRNLFRHVIAVNTRHKCSLSSVSHPCRQFISSSQNSILHQHQKQSFLFHSVRSLSSSFPTRMGPIRNKDGHEEDPAKIIDKAIAENAVVIFSKSFCPFCTRIKEFFAGKGIAFVAFELDTMGKQGEEIQSTLHERTKQATVPSVWVKGKFIGNKFSFFSVLLLGQIFALFILI